jgi:hypothetical protein
VPGARQQSQRLSLGVLGGVRVRAGVHDYAMVLGISQSRGCTHADGSATAADQSGGARQGGPKNLETGHNTMRGGGGGDGGGSCKKKIPSLA